MPAAPLPALEKAMRYLAARPLSELELLAKLRRAGYSDCEADAAIDECRKRHYLDDDLLTGDCVNYLRTQRNLGSRQIKFKLAKRGLDMETVSEMLAEKPEEELLAAQRAAETKLRLLKNENDCRKKREKLFRFLTARGFSPDIVFKVLDLTLHRTDE
ncbi:MAG: regulatory protein RecX [Lentisphaeria bacterium]|nr:regulatory protein RecX [Lentisphaeria bacterium]